MSTDKSLFNEPVHPNPPIYDLYSDSDKEGWKISPSMIGGLLGQMSSYGVDYYTCLAHIWERSQPDYFLECLKHHGYTQTKSKWFVNCWGKPRYGQRVMSEVDKAVTDVTNRYTHISNAVAEAWMWLIPRGVSDSERKLFQELLENEIYRMVFTRSGTIGEEEDIVSFFGDGNFTELIGPHLPGTRLYAYKRQGLNLNGLPQYFNDNYGTASYPVRNVKISHKPEKLAAGKSDEIWHNYKWAAGSVGAKWGASAWGKFDGVLSGAVGHGANKIKYFDVFEAKQRQTNDSMKYEMGKDSEITQMHMYMMMVEWEKANRQPKWRWGQGSSDVATTGAWLLQTSVNERSLQTLSHLPFDMNVVNCIDKIVARACQDLNKIQIYLFRDERRQEEGRILQANILKSVGCSF
tara:strand:+ start:11113 stop:12330 length:1218 start_codon:yes stop_codon:yes gene_type:complete